VWIAANVFSLAHFDMSGFVPRLLLGACFGYGMLWSGSLWTAVACHALNNCMAVTAMWLEEGGNAAGEQIQSFGAGSVSLIVASSI
ncbi:MAG: CPBP family intramembrane metalloprotease, partial [Paramuribaculum sp.]|nr:CPBP family intramembrane metalloprotease [Paramuribaculum sp.]